MDNFRSKSCRDGRNMQIEPYNYNNSNNKPTNMSDLRSFSSSTVQPPQPTLNTLSKDINIKKSKKLGSTSKSWSFNDPEIQRKKRVAGYKVYTVEGKMKGSLRKSFRWIKDIVYGWR